MTYLKNDKRDLMTILAVIFFLFSLFYTLQFFFHEKMLSFRYFKIILFLAKIQSSFLYIILYVFESKLYTSKIRLTHAIKHSCPSKKLKKNNNIFSKILY